MGDDPHRPQPSLEYVIVEIHTDGGITGVGEACTDIGFFGEPVEEVQSAIDLYLGPKLLGEGPFDREHLPAQIDFPGNTCAKSGIDLALHDLPGKALGVPVCNLIGGSARRQVRAAVDVVGGTPDGMARQCAEWVAQGVRGFNAKVGAVPEEDAERLAAIRTAVGLRSCCAPTPIRATRQRRRSGCAACASAAASAWSCWSSRSRSGASPAWPRCVRRWTC